MSHLSPRRLHPPSRPHLTPAVHTSLSRYTRKTHVGAYGKFGHTVLTRLAGYELGVHRFHPWAPSVGYV